MAALNIAHELLQLKNATPDLFAAVDSEALSHQLHGMENRLDAALSEYQSTTV